eukprot:jgi/Chlat1/4369/Chrsp29S04515
MAMGVLGAADVLWRLADEFEAQGAYLEAIKCLEALCQSRRAFLPLIEVKTRLKLADILYSQTHNLHEAKAHLERAQVLLQQIPRQENLKCLACSQLGRCYAALGATRLQKQVLRRGLQICEATIPSGDEDWVMTCWKADLALQLGDALKTEGDLDGALQLLETIITTMADCSDIKLLARKALLQLASVHVRLLKGEYGLAVKALSTSTVLQTSMFQSVPATSDASVSTALAQIPAMHLMLQVLCSVASGHGVPDDGLEQLRQACHKVEKSHFASCNWLQPSGLNMLRHLLEAINQRKKGNGQKTARGCLETVLRKSQEVLLNLNFSAGLTESKLSLKTVELVRPYLPMRFVAFENLAVLSLTQMKLEQAQKEVASAVSLVIAYPTLLAYQRATAHVLCAHYAVATCCFKEALKQYASYGKTSFHRTEQVLAAVFMALTTLCIGGHTADSDALDILQPIHREQDRLSSKYEEAAVKYALAVVNSRQGNHQEAKTALSGILDLAHNKMANHQLVSQVLILLGRESLIAHDLSAARNLLASAFTLAKAFHDPPLQLAAATALRDESRLSNDNKAAGYDSYIERKSKEWQQQIATARNSTMHGQLLSFNL